MLTKALKSKIHRATVTAASVDYPGSIAIDSKLLEAAGIAPYEAVLVANIANGSRFETYVVPAEAGSGKIEILGAAAHLAGPGDLVIILCFGFFDAEEMAKHKPVVVIPDAKNAIKEIH